MPGVSQALVEFANHRRPESEPGHLPRAGSARLEIARGAGVSGLALWGGEMSAPILSGLGFETVCWRRFYLDTSTA